MRSPDKHTDAGLWIRYYLCQASTLVFLLPTTKRRGLRSGLLTSKKQSAMSFLDKGLVPIRCCAVVSLLCYLLAGASLVLPSESLCARCITLGKAGTMKPGASCPLSSHEVRCHTTRRKAAGTIVLCTDGCLRHHGQGGAIPSLAKFLSAPCPDLPGWCPAGLASEETRLALSEASLSPPHHPPSPHAS
jgi:hypothetical protein